MGYHPIVPITRAPILPLLQHLPPPTHQLRIDFNITTPALSCERVSVDVLDLFGGTNELVVAKDIETVLICSNSCTRSGKSCCNCSFLAAVHVIVLSNFRRYRTSIDFLPPCTLWMNQTRTFPEDATHSTPYPTQEHAQISGQRR